LEKWKSQMQVEDPEVCSGIPEKKSSRLKTENPKKK
jgi:hypothetical protein